MRCMLLLFEAVLDAAAASAADVIISAESSSIVHVGLSITNSTFMVNDSSYGSACHSISVSRVIPPPLSLLPLPLTFPCSLFDAITKLELGERLLINPSLSVIHQWLTASAKASPELVVSCDSDMKKVSRFCRDERALLFSHSSNLPYFGAIFHMFRMFVIR